MPSTLDNILASTRIRVADAKANANRKQLEKFAQDHTPRGFRRALEFKSQTSPAIIAELKKASPSKGIIREDFHAASLAREVQSAGAACLSILTEPEFFQGGLGNLEMASFTTQLPCLRKDFIIDEFQMLEARAHRADAVLLIVAALTDAELKHLQTAARVMRLDVLCEVHNAEELDRALQAGCNDMIGINNRNLHDFSVTLQTSLDLVQRIPDTAIKVAESGIDTGEAIATLHAAGFDAFLIGEALMRAPAPGAALQQLIESAEHAASARA